MTDTPQDPVSTPRYSEGCQALRHYSLGVLRVRTIAIAQGFAVLAAAGYLVREDSDSRLYATAVSLFGFAFTVVLYSLQLNYWKHFEAVLGYVKRLERASPSAGLDQGPWSVYETQRAERFRRPFWKVFTIHGPYVLLLLALITLVAFTWLG